MPEGDDDDAVQRTLSCRNNYYEVLNVSRRSANFDREVRDAYKRLSLKLHPDKNENSAEAEEAFKVLGSAYETLRDPVKRYDYDNREQFAALREADRREREERAEEEVRQRKRDAKQERRRNREEAEAAEDAAEEEEWSRKRSKEEEEEEEAAKWRTTWGREANKKSSEREREQWREKERKAKEAEKASATRMKAAAVLFGLFCILVFAIALKVEYDKSKRFSAWSGKPKNTNKKQESKSSSGPRIELVMSEAADDATFRKVCHTSLKSFCVVVFMPKLDDCNEWCRRESLEVLSTAAKDNREDTWNWLWVEAGKQPELEAALRLKKSYPILVAISLKQKRFWGLRPEGEDFSRRELDAFMADKGRGRVFPDEGMPTLRNLRLS